MTKDEAPIKGEGMISDPDEYDWKCGCALCEVRYKNWKSDYDVQQAALRNEALDKKAENARELGLDYEPDYKVTVVDDQHPKGVPLERWGRSAPAQEPVKFLANGTRFKTSESPYGVCINSLPKELSGRWVALVAAEDDCHLQLTTPPAAQRTWVHLTDEQIHEACWESYIDPVTGECSTGDRECAVRWALAKLKELNT
jgi:hypothetical protein